TPRVFASCASCCAINRGQIPRSSRRNVRDRSSQRRKQHAARTHVCTTAPAACHPVKALGASSLLIDPHSGYLALGRDPAQRRSAYRYLFKADLTNAERTEILSPVIICR